MLNAWHFLDYEFVTVRSFGFSFFSSNQTIFKLVDNFEQLDEKYFIDSKVRSLSVCLYGLRKTTAKLMKTFKLMGNSRGRDITTNNKVKRWKNRNDGGPHKWLSKPNFRLFFIIIDYSSHSVLLLLRLLLILNWALEIGSFSSCAFSLYLSLLSGSSALLMNASIQIINPLENITTDPCDEQRTTNIQQLHQIVYAKEERTNE